MVGEERAVDRVPVLIDQVARGVGHLVAVPGHAGRARPELRRDVPVTEQALVAGVAARLAGQAVSHRGRARRGLPELDAPRRRAERACLGTVHRDADIVRGLRVFEGVGIGGELLHLRRIGAEHLGDVHRSVLQFLVHRGRVTDIAAGPGERHPRRRGGGVRRRGRGGGGRRGGRVDQGRVGVVARVRGCRGVEDRVRPVGERASLIGRAVGVVRLVGVADRHARPVAVQAGEGGQQVIGGVRDERGVVVGRERAVVFEEVQQARHHFQVRRHVGVVAEEMDIVEGELDDVLDPVAQAAAAARLGAGGRRGPCRWLPG